VVASVRAKRKQVRASYLKGQLEAARYERLPSRASPRASAFMRCRRSRPTALVTALSHELPAGVDQPKPFVKRTADGGSGRNPSFNEAKKAIGGRPILAIERARQLVSNGVALRSLGTSIKPTGEGPLSTGSYRAPRCGKLTYVGLFCTLFSEPVDEHWPAARGRLWPVPCRCSKTGRLLNGTSHPHIA
jgi:hypothetical protein